MCVSWLSSPGLNYCVSHFTRLFSFTEYTWIWKISEGTPGGYYQVTVKTILEHNKFVLMQFSLLGRHVNVLCIIYKHII